MRCVVGLVAMAVGLGGAAAGVGVAGTAEVSQWTGGVAGRMQQLSLTQLEALYALLDDDGSGDVRRLSLCFALILSLFPPLSHD